MRLQQTNQFLINTGAMSLLFPPMRPSAVVMVSTTEEVSNVLAYCNQERIPVVPFGAGTSLEGHVVPIYGG